ncbi:MAG: excisionase family DNA-binding protein [Myxococcota bacterium]
MISAEPWVSVDEATRHLGVAKGSIYRWTEHRRVCANKVGSFSRFNLSEVDEWLDAGGVSTEDDPGNRGCAE